MGWLWGSSSNASDPTTQLDPSLKKFLDKESADASTAPALHKEAPKPALPIVQPTPTDAPASSQQPKHDTNNKNNVPAESLYQDGRYAHLWKTYEPLTAIESRAKSDQEKLSDIISAYNERRENIGRAALENCAVEQIALSDCFRTGSWAARLTMCRAETRELDRCYTMQARFLKALGYLSEAGRDERAEERVQMHADRLYQRMLAQERAVAEAKEKGETPPVFGSILSKANVAAAMRGDVPDAAPVRPDVEAKLRAFEQGEHVASLDDLKGLAPKARQEFEDRLKKMSTEERELELRAIVGEWASAQALTKQVEGFYEEERKRRLVRQGEGKETVGDTLKRWWGW
ncbi:uncharacterized protein K452DRAFT_229545 [Aplosporella prunicola CBS 121167]|uniref:Autophagy-related protein 6 n=1 Tax=Aplosporella prunicola CBS 121167 TaxID=1176127 RepID=A0A6A6BC49_9PEZI|nr:uncharacterized protein K452DRAFT_229545 [Aplosporella prunicola CBS 121167]KAF2140953.1 hypothetical protein K452DRAFT_229545 [Aplosporella prunicola CBS 121167]